ncbi:unnamed protein product [Periconia digitata]|uniref:Uncharacterized protein n=1 Tax=Periconia digitata TaxID=1303443 RepID=A0A9W4XQW7_9PLEO|nr:unnamed protein product [Periconia digitata]
MDFSHHTDDKHTLAVDFPSAFMDTSLKNNATNNFSEHVDAGDHQGVNPVTDDKSDTKDCEDDADNLDGLGADLVTFETTIEHERIAELEAKLSTEQALADESFKIIEDLRRRIAVKSATNTMIDPDFVAVLDSLFAKDRHLVNENKRLREDLQNAKRQVTLLSDDNEGKARKIRGAHKKAQNARDMAVKEEEKAKEAVNQRNQSLKQQQQQQKKNMNASLAEVASHKKMVQTLESDLLTAWSGHPYLKDKTATTEDEIASFSISLKIRRKDFPPFKHILVNSQAKMTAELEDQYHDWKERQQCVTGYEHDGQRSSRGLQVVAQHAMQNPRS